MTARWTMLVALVSLTAACGGGSGGGTNNGAKLGGGGTSNLPPPAITAPAQFADGLVGPQVFQADAPQASAVEFQIDGQTLVTDPAAPYQTSFNADDYVGGQHILRARARDAAQNFTDWQTITVRVGGNRTSPIGFGKNDGWVTGLVGASAFAQAPDGRIFVAQQGGDLLVVKDGVLLPTPFLSLNVDSSGERGLLGVAFDPNFNTNGFVYVYYTTTAPAHNRISRFTAVLDRASGSEAVLVDLPNLSDATNHNGGAVHFGPDGKLYAGVGENASPNKAQDRNDPFGKILRFNADGSIPSDNPFCSTSELRCAVWAYGLRNPFTFAFQPGTGRMHINDVGETTWEEIDVGTAGANYGWPTSEGPDNTAGFTAPIFSYGHAAASPPGSGPGGFFTGIAIAGGAFYPSGGTFPQNYQGNYFFADFGSQFVARLDLANSNAAYAFALVNDSPVDMLVGADGALYVLKRGSITRIASN